MTVPRETFDHIGIPTDVEQPGEVFVPATKVWVTSPRAHPGNVEWLRYEADSPVTGPLRAMPHVAYRTTDLEASIRDRKILLEPFDVGDGFVRVAFVLIEGAPVEFMQYADPNEEGWFV